jgi:hypothetical protein
MKSHRRCQRGIAPAVLALATLFARPVKADDAHPNLRPPAVPLVTFDPYLSIWSEADRLTDDVTRHWTHHPHPLVSLIRVDGKPYRLMGATPADTPALPQTGLQVLPTRSIYEFEGANVHVTLTFMTPALPHDLDVLARPLAYITWNVHSTDDAAHAVSLYDSASSLLTVNTPGQKVQWKHESAGKLTALRIGTDEQPLLTPMGDDVRIDWGYAYLAAPATQSTSAIGPAKTLENAFVTQGKLPTGDDTRMPRAASDDAPTLAVAFDLGQVGTAPVARHVMLAYDEIYAIKYFGKKLRPYWRRNGMTPATLLQSAERDYATLTTRCAQFDRELMADAESVGGAKYAQIIALAYRQCLAGCGLAADSNRQPLWFTKENTSNGDLATVDVIFPMAPMPLLFSPTLAKASLVSVLDYAASSHWKFPNAPHDLGTYPVAMGRDDGGEGMPVEESGNMLLMCDAIARMEGSPAFASRYWPQLTQWEKYLEQYGNDPENQLCTDDFMGHLAHNANLSVKAILAIAAYGDLCRMRGDSATADRLQGLARQYALHWIQVAGEGDHYRLAFDRSHTWSQKYNLVWDKILGLNVFPPSVAQTEFAYYKSVMQPYGVPLDSRTRLTKTDWTFWSATLADSKQDFESLIAPVYAYLNQTTAHSPLVDSYITDDVKSDGMHARPVVGGLFVKMLADPQMWKKWSRDEQTKGIGNWAALPTPPHVVTVVPTSEQAAQTWRYTTEKPSEGWMQSGFDDASWKSGQGGFGTEGTPGAIVHTTWNTGDIWLRRTFIMPVGNISHLQLYVYHDEDVDVYINGVLAATEAGFVNAYQPMDIRATARVLLKPGTKITLAAHCHQTEGGQGVDVGLVNVTER